MNTTYAAMLFPKDSGERMPDRCPNGYGRVQIVAAPFSRIKGLELTGGIMLRFVPAVALLVGMCGTISAANWPGFRGPTGDGISQEKKLPLKWSATENVRLKTALPEGGNSSGRFP